MATPGTDLAENLPSPSKTDLNTATPSSTAPATSTTSATPTTSVSRDPSDQVVGIGDNAGKPLQVTSQHLEELFTANSYGLYDSRTLAGRKQGLAKYGGTQQTEDCVSLGLAWLARHQDADGKWDGVRFVEHCVGDGCEGKGIAKYTTGLTALSLMCFLAAGHTPTQGQYAEKLELTRRYLLSTQDEEGFLGQQNMYNHALTLLALLELYGQSKDVRLAQPIRKGVWGIGAAQQPQGGWTYEAKPSKPRHDTSVTGWQILALLAAKRSGFGVPDRVLTRAFGHMEQYTLATGEVRYADIGPQASRKTDALVSVALLCTLLSGQISPQTHRQLTIINRHLPDWQNLSSWDHSMYYWYHGTLAMFVIGGKPWEQWNRRLQAELIRHQVKSGEAKGSWPADDKWSASGGRIYSTAINILNLEIYYRYRPVFLHSLPPSVLVQLQSQGE